MPNEKFSAFHTQEKRTKKLTKPIQCVNDNAWLGTGYYFWYEHGDAILWGQSAKKRTGRFEIYEALIKNENILDTVFNEEHYMFWLKQIEKVAKRITKLTNQKPSIKEINEYFKERGCWVEFKGILFQDIPMSKTILVVGLYYKKRIQLVLFDLDNIIKFNFLEEGIC